MPAKEFDPIAYIENAFLDNETKDKPSKNGRNGVSDSQAKGTATLEPPKKFRRRQLSAPRPRRKRATPPSHAIDPELQALWSSLPRNIAFLSSFFDDGVTANYYRGEFKESRMELIRRILDPELTLEEVSRLLGVCPATVRRYTNRGWMVCHRTKGGQRRFRLSGVVKFVDEHGRLPEE